MNTSARHNEEFTAPVQLESLLEVPVKLILIEDLIREKSALVHSDCVDISKEKNNNQRLSQSAEGSNSPPPHEKDICEEGSQKKCLFECCAIPSRWRNTECYSNKSFFRTVSIPLPCNSLAVIPVMQVEESAVTNNSKSANSRNVSAIMPNPAKSSANEDTHTDSEMNKESEDEKDARKHSLSESDSLPSLVSSKNPPTTNTSKSGNDDTNKVPSEDDEGGNTTSHPKKPNIENPIEQETSPSRNDGQDIETKSPSIQPSELSHSSSTTFIGKVTEKPTRFEDLISGQYNNKISSETSNTITPSRQQCQQEEENDAGAGSSKSADDTLKLTFYNEGRKESTKEFRTTGIESGGVSSPGSDVRFFESRHGLQMSRVIREVGSASLDRIARVEQQQHPVILTEGESEGLKDPKNDSHKNSKGDTPSPMSESITQTHLQRLISSTDQKNNSSSDTNSPTNSSSGTGNNNSSVKDISKSANSPHERPWDGLRISRCQKEIVGEVITLEGESSSHEPPESDSSHLPYKEKGESENSVERHLQSYLTSLRFVKPTESENGKNQPSDYQDSDNAKAKSPVISPQSRQAQTTIMSPRISTPTRSPGSGGSVIANEGVVRIPVVQRVSPSSQQDGSSECWPERSIARIPTRPFLRRNITYEVNQPQQQQHQQQQQSIISQRQNIQRNMQTYQQRVEDISHATQQASSAEFPLHSPPKRFKSTSTILPTTQYGNSPMPPVQSHVQQQQHHPNQQAILNKYPSNIVQSQQSNRIANTGISHNDNMSPQQHHSALSPNNVSWARSSGVNYNNMQQQQQHYPNSNPRPSSTAYPYPTAGSNVSTKISPPQRSPATASQPLKYPANAYSHSQQHLEYQRQLQQSLLIASSSLASSSTEPIDSSYEERLRRYTEIYQRQQLDKNKLTEYYDKYHFYPWDILTARDESIIRQMRSQQQSSHSHVPQSPTHQVAHANQQAASKESMTNSVVQYDASRRIEVENTSLQHQHRQFQTRPSNLEHSPVRNPPAPTFSPSYASASNVSPPMISPQQTAQHIQQTRYSHVQQMQQIQHVQQRGDYVVHQHQQQAQNRYYHRNDQPDQNYRNHNQQNPSRILQSPVGTVPTNRDIQNSPHYRNAYNQLAAAAAAVSSVAAGAAVGGGTGTNPQNPLRITDGRTSTNPNAVQSRDERITQFLHSRSGGGASKPVIMTVADPVHAPVPPEAVPLSIHRQALEQAIKSNQAGVVHGSVSNLHGMVNRDDGSSHFRHDQRTIPISPQYHRQVMSQHAYYENPHPRNVTIDGRVVTGLGVQSVGNEPLRRVPSPTLAHQTSVIRRIQQHESPPAPTRSPFVGTGSVSRHFIESDRPGISFRRISDGSSTDSNGGGPSNPASFLYQQQQHKENSIQGPASSHYQQLHHHRLSNSLVPRHSSSEMAIQRNVMSIENGQGISRATHKRRIIITDNNGINQTHQERCHEVGSSSTPLIARSGDIPANQIELPGRDEDRGNSIGDNCQYDHVVLIDKHNKTYRCKRCFETVKTEQQIRNHLFCKMLANHVQCHVCLQLITTDKYPEHLLTHGVQPPENLDN